MKTLSKMLQKSNYKRARVITTMFSLSNPKGILKLFKEHLPLLVIFASGLTRVAPRLRHFNKFSHLLLRTYKHHGALYTVKWLKACHTAIQKYISGQPFKTLRTIEPDLPLPRLINGLPYFIGTVDRRLIRERHAPTVRLWLTILSVYRVLKAPVKWKLETITNPYGGSEIYIDVLSHGIFTSLRFWKANTDYFSHLAMRKLKCDRLRLSLKSGPNHGVSWKGILVDALSVFRFYPVLQAFRHYAELTDSG